MNLKKFFSEFGFEPVVNNPILYRLKNENVFSKIFFGLSRITGRAPFMMFKNSFFPEVNPRIVEMPFVFQNLPKGEKLKILDFGCSESLLPIQMATLGYDVHGADLQEYPFKHINFTFHHGNFLDNKFKAGTFDIVTAISSVEHSGLGSYESPKFSGGDIKILQEIKRVMKKDGVLILTVPFGQKYKDGFQRVYDNEALIHFIKGFKIVLRKHYIRKNKRQMWVEATINEAEKKKYVGINEPEGVVCLILTKS